MSRRPGVRGRRGVLWVRPAAWTGVAARARRDRVLLLVLTITVALSALVALSGPSLLGRALDVGLRESVAEAGGQGQIRVEVQLDLPEPAAGGKRARVRITGADLASVGASLGPLLPDGLAAARGPVLVTAGSAPLPVTAGAPGGRLGLRLGYAAGPGSGVDLLRGRAADVGATPPAGDGEVPVTVTQPVAAATGLVPGTRLQVRSPSNQVFTVLVTGVVRPREPRSAVWGALPSALTPLPAEGATEVTALLSGSGLPVAGTKLAGTGSLRAAVRQTLDPAALRADRLPALRSALTELQAAPPEVAYPSTTRTELPQVLDRYAEQSMAVRAQLSVLLVGAVGVAVLLTLLAARTLVARRREDLALEYARGGSASLLAIRSAGESSLLAAVAGAAAWLVAWWWWRVPAGTDALPFWTVLATGALGPPLLGAAAARKAWFGPGGSRTTLREGADPDRGAPSGRRGIWELVLLALALGAVLSLRGRGLTSAGFSGQVDPYLAATPTLLALVGALVAVRLQPGPMRVLTGLARRGRGMVGLVATARAGRGLLAIPLLALTLAVAIAVATGLIRTTVLTGQDEASWQRVGADVRAGGTFTEADAEAVRRAPGVRHVVLLTRLGTLRTSGALPAGGTAEVVSADARRYAELLADLPLGGAADTARLAGVAGAGGRVPILAGAGIATALARPGATIAVGERFYPADVVGPAPTAATAGWLADGLVLVDQATAVRLDRQLSQPTVLLATGPGAGRAVAALPGVDPDRLVLRSGWLSQARRAALARQVLDLSWLAVLATGALAAAAVVGSVVTGSRQRGRALAVLRTLGLRARAGRFLAIAELAPTLIVGTVAGSLAGVGIVVLLGPALGLRTWTQGVGAPAVRADPWFLLAVLAGVALVFALATAVELAAHRRDRLSDVLRTR